MNIFTERYKEMGEKISFPKIRRSIRVNTKKISPSKLRKRLESRNIILEKIPFLKNSFYTKSHFNIVSSPEYLLGLFYIQEAASQIPAEVLSPKGLVLDACAAPGSKTTQLSEYCNVIAVDNSKERFTSLTNNLERLDIDNCIAYLLDFRKVKKKFNYILLDAPCSGNYMLEEKWMKKNSLKRIQERSNLQKELISHAISLLSKNGRLVYSTCSLEPEEDEEVIQFALDNFHVKLEKIDCIGTPGLTSFYKQKFDKTMKHTKRLWPHKTNTSGFFIGSLRKC